MSYCRVAHLLRRRAALDGSGTALIGGGERLSFAEFEGRANAAAHLLTGLGLDRGDHFAVLARNSPAYCELYYAAAQCGAVLCGLNFRLAAPELGVILSDSGARLIFADSEFIETAQAVAAETGAIVVAIGESTATMLNYEQLRNKSPSDPIDTEATSDDPLVLVYTSGTTGKPKGALLTQSQMYWSSATMACSLDFRRGDVNLIAAPLFHVGGISFATLAVHLGATAILLPRWDPEEVWRLIVSERINHFFAVPAMLRTLLEHSSDTQSNGSSLRWILSGGAPVPPELIQAFGELGIPISQTYGSTESAGPATFLDPQRAVRKAGTAGRPFFYTDVRIVNADGQSQRSDAIGEIEVRGPHIFAGYWKNDEATGAVFDGDWLRMGDLGWIDPDGDLHIVGRKKEVIITGGENVYPAEIEMLLQTHPAILEAAVVGIPDPHWGEAVCAVVVGRSGANLTLRDLESYCAGKIARYKIPRRIVVRSTPLPRNTAGKLLKHQLGLNPDVP